MLVRAIIIDNGLIIKLLYRASGKEQDFEFKPPKDRPSHPQAVSQTYGSYTGSRVKADILASLFTP